MNLIYPKFWLGIFFNTCWIFISQLWIEKTHCFGPLLIMENFLLSQSLEELMTHFYLINHLENLIGFGNWLSFLKLRCFCSNYVIILNFLEVIYFVVVYLWVLFVLLASHRLKIQNIFWLVTLLWCKFGICMFSMSRSISILSITPKFLLGMLYMIFISVTFYHVFRPVVLP